MGQNVARCPDPRLWVDRARRGRVGWVRLRMDLNFKKLASRLRAYLGPLSAGLACACALSPGCSTRGSTPSPDETGLDPAAATVWLEREAFVMGTRLRVTLAAPDATQGVAGAEAMFREVRRLDAVLSSWRDDSEMARLNASPVCVPFQLSADLSILLTEIRPWVVWSGGAFDPGVGPLIDAWDLRGAGRWPTPAELERARELSGLDAYALDEREGVVVKRRPGVWISAGGFGKGAALRAATSALDAAGIEAALIDFGGQLVALGVAPGDDAWVVEIAHPSRRQLGVATLGVTGVSVATSGSSERYVEVEGRRLGHIVDPRSGWPVPAWGSVTVVAADPLTADVAATALFVLGPEAGLAIAVTRDDLGVLFLVEEDERIEARWNERMAKYLIAPASDPASRGTNRAVVRYESGSPPFEVLSR